MQHVDTYEQDRARRARIEAEYKERVKGQLFQTGTNKDNLTGFLTPKDKPLKGPFINAWRINLK